MVYIEVTPKLYSTFTRKPIPVLVSDIGNLYIKHTDGSIIDIDGDFNLIYRKNLQDAKSECMYYIHDGYPYRLIRVAKNANENGLVNTTLIACFIGTLFCKCDQCGKIFQVPSPSPDIGMVERDKIPSVCPECQNNM